MADPIFERYKDALRAGHVAALHGRFEDALEHYREAAALADDRALPHTSMGNVLLRLGRYREAEAAYGRALSRSPDDDAGLAGLAEVLAALGRTDEAAGMFERLAAVRARHGRLEDAIAAQQAVVDLASTDARLARLHGLQEGMPTRTQPVPAPTVPLAAGQPGPTVPLAAGQPGPAAIPTLETPEAAVSVSVPFASVPGGAGTETTAFDAPRVGPPTDPVAAERRIADADRAGDAADRPRAVGAYLDAADAYASAGALDAALDASERAMALAPTSRAVHLTLARLYRARGWRDLADEKLRLVDALRAVRGSDAELDGSLAGVAPVGAVDPELRFTAAQVAADEGDREMAVWGFLQAADGYAAAGAVDAALDACQRALLVAPASVGVQGALLRLYVARGWRDAADRKLRLLERLVAFDGTEEDRRAVAALARTVVPQA